MTGVRFPAPAPLHSQAVIEVTTSFFVLAFVLYLCKPRVAINGHEAVQKWGTVSIPVAPGRYQVEAWTHYLFASHMGRNGVVIDAHPGTVTRVRWKAPWLVFLQGSIAVTDVVPFAQAESIATTPAPPATPSAAAAGWYPDPAGRHEQRYHDGSAWTEHVSSAGVAGSDPAEP